MLIGIVEETAKIRLNAQYSEVVSAHQVDPGAGWIFARVEASQSDVISRQTIKAAIAIAQLEIVGIRLGRGNARAPNRVEALLLRQTQRVK